MVLQLCIFCLLLVLAELAELNLKINELDRGIIEYEGKSTRIESELQELRMVKENEQNLIGELDKKYKPC